MAINYTWDVSTVDTYPTKDSNSDVVHNVHWRITGSDSSNKDSNDNPQTATVYGSVGLDTSDLSSFTNWSSLDAAKVQGWVEAALGSTKVTEMKASIDAQIAEKVKPTSVTKTLG